MYIGTFGPFAFFSLSILYSNLISHRTFPPTRHSPLTPQPPPTSLHPPSLPPSPQNHLLQPNTTRHVCPHPPLVHRPSPAPNLPLHRERVYTQDHVRLRCRMISIPREIKLGTFTDEGELMGSSPGAQRSIGVRLSGGWVGEKEVEIGFGRNG
jgi:hypothetical protein